MTASIQQIPTSVSVNANLEDIGSTSWGAIFSGVSIALALYLVFLILGVGLGFTVLSPWNFQHYSVGAMGMATVFWLIVTQIVSSAGGGYVAGRLAPVAWNSSFYPVVHGLVVWALGSIGISLLLGTLASNILSGGASVIASASNGLSTGLGAGIGAGFRAIYSDVNESGAEGVGGKQNESDQNGTHAESGRGGGSSGRGSEASSGLSLSQNDESILDYAVDLLFRPLPEGNQTDDAQRERALSKVHGGDRAMQRREITRIFINAVQTGKIFDTDKRYIAQLVTERTGLSHEEALRRVNDTLDQAKGAFDRAQFQARKALDSTRKATAIVALWTFVSWVGGALVAALAAGWGGGRRRALAGRNLINDDELAGL